MNLDNFKKHSDWVKVWSGKWSLNFDSHVGNDWTKTLTVGGFPIFKKVIYFYTNGITDCWVSRSEKDYLGERFNNLARADGAYLENLPKSFKTMADTVTAFLNSHDPAKLSTGELDDFWKLVGKYYLPHLSVKYIVDYFTPEVLEKYLPMFENARLYAEPIFRNTENFWESFAEHTALQAGCSKEMILATLKGEIEAYFGGTPLPDKNILKNRYARSVLLVEEARQELFVGKDTGLIEDIVRSKIQMDLIRGQIAYQGKSAGRVRIVWNPSDPSIVFEYGDILVTGMTRPEFLPLMKKAGAFITDAGGILSHAAIVAREMKKPCIIGTGVATKVLKDGDLVEVDANVGVVKILKTG